MDTDLYLVSGETPDSGDLLNHSCEPNWWPERAVAADRDADIVPGEELSFDYAMSDASDYDEFHCLRGYTAGDRHRIRTGGIPLLARKVRGLVLASYRAQDRCRSASR